MFEADDVFDVALKPLIQRDEKINRATRLARN